MKSDAYKSLFENSCAVMLLIHPETGNIIDANYAACKYYGYPKDQLINMKIQEINILSKEEIFNEMQRAKEEMRCYFNFKHELANGDVKEVEVFSGPINLGREKVLYSIVHDISERKLMEKQIQIEKMFSDSLIKSLPGVMYVFDQQGNFIRWNKNFEEVTEYSPDQIQKMTPLDFIAKEDRAHVRRAIEEVFISGLANVEAKLLTVQGKTIPHLLTGYQFISQDINYLVGMGLDISSRVESELEKEKLIAKLQDSLSQVKQLSGFLPICSSCKKIRDDKGYWKQVEAYIEDHSEAQFSHSICKDCSDKLYGQQEWYKKKFSDNKKTT